MTMDCMRFARALDRLALGEPAVDRAWLAAHAAACPACAAAQTSAERLTDDLRRALDCRSGADDPESISPVLKIAYWDQIDSPIGRLYLATGEDGQVRRVTFDRNALTFVDDLLARGWIPVPDRDRTARLAAQLAEFFAGRRRQFDLEVDLTPLRPFHRAVLEACARVPFGGASTYGELAATIGRPGAARAVGNALGANPIPLIVPCHRILAAGRRIGGYGGGLDVKRALLRLEGREVA